MLSTAHPFVNHLCKSPRFEVKGVSSEKYQCCCTLLVMSQLLFQHISYAFPQKESFIPFLTGILRPTNLNTQSSPDQPCKSTKILTNRGSRPYFCSGNILRPPLPCSRLTHPAEECAPWAIDSSELHDGMAILHVNF